MVSTCCVVYLKENKRYRRIWMEYLGSSTHVEVSAYDP